MLFSLKTTSKNKNFELTHTCFKEKDYLKTEDWKMKTKDNQKLKTKGQKLKTKRLRTTFSLKMTSKADNFDKVWWHWLTEDWKLENED